jgi:hypothetical protein
LIFNDPVREVAIMWARRVLLATMVAVCAMTLPRHVPASFNAGAASTNLAISSSR